MIPLYFYKTEAGNHPVREWLSNLPEEERTKIQESIQTVRRGWPIGMPLVKKCRGNIWEIRIKHKDRVSRVLFTVFPLNIEEGRKVKHAVLLHGFIKKDEQIPKKEMDLAIKRAKAL